tara:strand:- start:2520 stop:2768 length:249 start_codon:yes stop_codon:yes gene_type:complete
MAKVISVAEAATPEESMKMVEIKHTRTMQDANGKDVQVVDYVETQSVDDAISQAEARKVEFEAKATEADAELAELIAIRDAE